MDIIVLQQKGAIFGGLLQSAGTLACTLAD